MTAGIRAGVVLAIVLTCVTVQGKEVIGLLAQCSDVIRFMDRKEQEVKASFSMGLCVGLVEGVLKTMQSMNKQMPKVFQTCFPNRVITNDEGVRIVVKYLRETEMAETDGATLAMFAIQNSFPCE